MKATILIILTSLFATASFAQPPSYSLKEAIDYSLANHGSTTIYNNELEKVKLQSREALSAYLPQVNTNLTLDDNLRRQTTILPGAMFGQPKDIEVQLGNQYTTNAVVELNQTIYDQALLYGLQAGAPSKKIAELNIAKNHEELMYNTASSYSQILILKEQQKLLVANKKQYQDLYDITKFRLDKGVAKKVDLDRVTVQLNNIKAQEKQIQTDIDVAYNSLKNAMGLPLNAALQIEDSLDYSKYLQAGSDSLNVEKLIDYQLQQQNVSLQEIDVKRKQAASLPTVSAYARYGEQGFGNDLGTATSNWNDYSAVGVKVNIPIFSGKRRELQIKESKVDLANQKENLQLSTAQMQLQFQNAARQLQENVTTLTTNKNNMDLAKTVYETGQFEYSKGVSTMSDLLNTDFSYKQAQSTYITSLLNLVTNRLAYEKAKGTINNFINQL